MNKKAYFRFEASPVIGAGHAIRSCVIADALVEHGWQCSLMTSEESYSFIENLKRFNRIDPEVFYNTPEMHDLLVIDHYGLDLVDEKHFRPYAKKIMVIDDLADRRHDCDILLDQTYNRASEDYKHLVPESCKILTGSDYVLLRKEFIEMRPNAFEKRKNTIRVERILISMGGSDHGNYTLEALKLIKEAGFEGAIDIVLGFRAFNMEAIQAYTASLSNVCTIHTSGNMPQLIYEADLAIGAAGTSVWERCCLGLPQILMVTADNQQVIYENLVQHKICYSTKNINYVIENIHNIINKDIFHLFNALDKIMESLGNVDA